MLPPSSACEKGFFQDAARRHRAHDPDLQRRAGRDRGAQRRGDRRRLHRAEPGREQLRGQRRRSRCASSPARPAGAPPSSCAPASTAPPTSPAPPSPPRSSATPRTSPCAAGSAKQGYDDQHHRRRRREHHADRERPDAHAVPERSARRRLASRAVGVPTRARSRRTRARRRGLPLERRRLPDHGAALCAPTILKEHPDAVQSLLAGHEQSVAWLNDNPTRPPTVINAKLAADTGKALSDAVIDPRARTRHLHDGSARRDLPGAPQGGRCCRHRQAGRRARIVRPVRAEQARSWPRGRSRSRPENSELSNR